MTWDDTACQRHCHAIGDQTVTRMDVNTPKTISVPTAGRVYFGLARNASYDAARRGEIPTIRIGRLLRVPVVGLERMLTEARPTARKEDVA
jgi:hypothetical protein